MMTDATTTVLLMKNRINNQELCAVFFGKCLAYLVEYDEAVKKCIKSKCFPDTHEASEKFKKVETKRDRN